VNPALTFSEPATGDEDTVLSVRVMVFELVLVRGVVQPRIDPVFLGNVKGDVEERTDSITHPQV
jgi:hypothetical protein